ncbi:hypothetical protein RJP21_21575 [Paenibacillus sp. VCA1]|nr:hypothetical protein [Paenibacillus sp. VCA1]MDR9856197.1 hypothetical protein [Paenibacillus sp. VCA1]
MAITSSNIIFTLWGIRHLVCPTDFDEEFQASTPGLPNHVAAGSFEA